MHVLRSQPARCLQEMRIAKQGLSEDPNAGRVGMDAIFESTAFQLDYLTEPTGLLDLGIDLKKVKTADRILPSDTAFIMAYPHFNVNGPPRSAPPTTPLPGIHRTAV